ncbi:MULTISPECIES: glycosyltransferase family 2 protein [unclassified Cryobacterium]|uniref:glycosyltransferase family 2 protein n=1 Tax=unclassified Cryobacterium TaxID=2649013 RepID=UPI00141A698F|nr:MULTISPECIES: glycosyltransferase family 2 protein [unclassified Cryobacterium]
MGNDYRVVIVIATYQRPLQLERLLTSLQPQLTGANVEIVVADNDIRGSAESIVRPFLALYTIEAKPGVSAVRNAGLELAMTLNPWAIVFVDDDETVEEDWLAQLLSAKIQTNADVVTGPVVYDVETRNESLIVTRQYLTTRIHGELEQIVYVSTNNVLVDAKWFAQPWGLRFDLSYGLTGGEDLELFLRIQGNGGICVWANGARVRTEVPPFRLEAAWNLHREMRNGQLMARLRRSFDGFSRFRLFAIGVGRISSGLVNSVHDMFLLQVPSLQARLKVFDGIGWIRGATGLLYNEYARPRESSDDVSFVKLGR